MGLTYHTGLFKETETYWCHRFKNRDEWLIGRNTIKGVGGSDSAAALGMSPWRTNVGLWKEKTNRTKYKIMETSPQMQYGIDAEDSIRRIYALDVQDEYEVHYIPDCIMQNKQLPCMIYSPDGLLKEIGSNRVGLLEIKTSTIHGNGEKWKNQIPQNYYIQVLHGMFVTGAEFAELRALLRYSGEYEAIRTYHIERADVEADIEYVKAGIIDFWGFVERDEEPPLIIGGLQ